jgi:hypothetical protein
VDELEAVVPYGTRLTELASADRSTGGVAVPRTVTAGPVARYRDYCERLPTCKPMCAASRPWGSSTSTCDRTTARRPTCMTDR